MANHRKPNKQRARKTVLAGLAAAGLSGALVIGHATNYTVDNLAFRLAASPDTALAAGGLFDDTSDRVRFKLQGAVIPDGYTYHGIDYPATMNLQGSRIAGANTLHLAITSLSDAPHLLVASYSEGTLVAEQVRRDLQAADPDDPFTPSPDQLSFLQLASPFAPNGGIYNRFPGVSIPGVTDAMGAGQPTRYDTTYVSLMYDSYADFPAYFNPFALLNSALAIRYAHPDPAYDPIDAANSPSYVTTVNPNAAGGKDTYVLIYNPHLPLLGPLRDVSALLGISAITEPFISAIEPLLRLAVDMAYTDRVNANPTASVPFSFITPPEKFLQAIAGVPGALAEGLNNLVSGGHATTALPNPIGNLQPSIPLPTGDPQVQSSQARMAVVPSVAPSTQPETPVQKLDLEPVKPSETESKPDVTPVIKSTAEDGLHPTVTSDGNKFTPGADGAAAQSVGTETSAPTGTATVADAKEPATTPTSTTDTATTTTPATTTGTTTAGTAGTTTAADSNADSADHAAAA